MKRQSMFRIPRDPKDVFAWLSKQMVLSLGCGGTLGLAALLIVGLSLFGFLIGDYQGTGQGVVNGGNVTLDDVTIAQDTALQTTYQEAATQWQKGLTQDQINQVEQQQVDLPAAVLMAIGKMENNMDPPNADTYYQYLQPRYTWDTFTDVTIRYSTVCDPNTNECHTHSQETDTPVTMLMTANTWDGTLTNTYKWVETMQGTTSDGVYTKKIVLDKSNRVYDWSRVWNLFQHVPTKDGHIIGNTRENEDTLAGLIGAVDYGVTDPEVQKMITQVLFTGGVQLSGIPYVSTAVPSGDTIQNILHYKDAIEAAAKMFNIPAVLIAGVMYQESGGNQLDSSGHILTSSAGALGLMQMLPSTAAGLTVNGQPVGGKAYAYLSNPATNILLGAEYLSELYHEFGQNIEETLAAYNAGPGAEQQALARGYQIPQYSETIQYVQNIAGHWIPALTPYFGGVQ
jgi:hypothetical protein